MKTSFINTIFLAHLDELILERGGSVASLLTLVGLPASTLVSPGLVVPFPLHSKLLDICAEQSSWPNLGLELAHRQSISFLGPIYPMVCKEQNVRTALSVFNKHLSVQVQSIQTSLEEYGAAANFVIRHNIGAIARSSCYQDHAIALGNNLLGCLVGAAWRPRAVFFPRSEPKNVAAYARYFKAPVCFEVDTLRISFDKALLDQKVNTSMQTMNYELRQQLAIDKAMDLSAQVRYVFKTVLSSGRCDTNYVADVLGYSRRSLQRSLSQEGTSFQALLDGTRAGLAKEYLQNDCYRIADVAILLGFSDQASFTRSFERWFNTSPSAWRKLIHNTHGEAIQIASV